MQEVKKAWTRLLRVQVPHPSNNKKYKVVVNLSLLSLNGEPLFNCPLRRASWEEDLLGARKNTRRVSVFFKTKIGFSSSLLPPS